MALVTLTNDLLGRILAGHGQESCIVNPWFDREQCTVCLGNDGELLCLCAICWVI